MESAFSFSLAPLPEILKELGLTLNSAAMFGAKL
jgi:hypothetical protein